MKIQDIINEEIMRFIKESVDIMGLKQLADIISNRFGGGEMEANAFFDMLRNSFKKEGDNGVKNMYHDITGGEIDDLSKGKYIFKENYIIDKPLNKTKHKSKLRV